MKILAIGLLSALLMILSGCVSKSQTAETSNNEPIFVLADAKGIITLQGNREVPLIKATAGAFLYDPALSMDQAKLAFIRQDPAITEKNGVLDFGSDLYMSTADGKDVRLLVKHAAPGEFLGSPVWFPNNQNVAYAVLGKDTAGQPDPHIEVLDIDSEKQTRLLSDAVLPSLAHDGRSLAFVRIDANSQLAQIDVFDLTSGATRVLVGLSHGLSQITSLAWSPDDGRVAFAAANPGPQQSVTKTSNPTTQLVIFPALFHPTLQDVWLVDKDGTNLRKIVDLAADRPSIAWSSSGDSLYVLTGEVFWKIDVSSGEHQQIGPGVPQGQIKLLSGN